MYILQDKQVAEAQMYFLQGKQVAEVPTKPSSASDQPQSQQQQPSNAVAPVATDGADKSASDTTLDEDVPVSSLSPTDQ